MVNEGKINQTSLLCTRVYLDINQPLVRYVPITLKNRKKYSIFNEKLLDFLPFLWCLGHMVEGGDGVHAPSECQWED